MYFYFFNLSSSFLSSVSSAKATLFGATFSLLKAFLAFLKSLFFSSILSQRNLMFLYFFDIFSAAIRAALSTYRLFFLVGFLKPANVSSVFFLCCLLLLYFFIIASWSSLNLLKSKTLFTTASMLSFAKSSSSICGCFISLSASISSFFIAIKVENFITCCQYTLASK